MVHKNLAQAKTHLSRLVNAALDGQDVVICKNGQPAVRLVAVRPISGDDPCRAIHELCVTIGEGALAPLGDDAWGSLK